MGLAFDLSAGCLLRHLQKPEEQKPEQITVGVAMNHDYKLGLLAAMNGYHIMGRSYTSSYQGSVREGRRIGNTVGATTSPNNLIMH